MGSRQSWALTEQEVIKLRNELHKQSNNLKYIYDILLYTGIRESEYKALAAAWSESKTRWLDVYISKQSKRKIKNEEGYSNKIVKRHIMLPKFVHQALLNNDFKLNELSESMIKKYVNYIQKIANEIGISRKISPHDFRATFINMIKHRGYDIWDVKNITQLSLKALQSYFERDSDVVEQAFKDLEKDRYDANNSKMIIRRNRELEDENKILRETIEQLKQEVNNG